MSTIQNMRQALIKLQEAFPDEYVSVDLIMESWHDNIYYSAYRSGKLDDPIDTGYSTYMNIDYAVEFTVPMQAVDWLIAQSKEEKCSHISPAQMDKTSK